MDKIFNKEKIIAGLKWFFYSFIWLFILMLIIDIVSKQLVIHNRDYIISREEGHGIILIPNFLAINYVINDSLAFGIKINDNPLAAKAVYITVAMIGIILITGIYAWKYKTFGKYVKACLMLILTGAVGNCIDRIFYSASYLGSQNGGVVDWINFYGIWQFNFNWADSCIVVGVIMLIIWLIIEEVKEYKIEKAKQPVIGKGTKVLSKEEQTRLEKEQANLSKKENMKAAEEKSQSKNPIKKEKNE